MDQKMDLVEYTVPFQAVVLNQIKTKLEKEEWDRILIQRAEDSQAHGMAGKGLIKLIEACGELMQISGKKAACMDTDDHWDGAGSLKTRLEDKIADVSAASQLVAENFSLDAQRIAKRTDVKLALFRKWDAMVDHETLNFSHV